MKETRILSATVEAREGTDGGATIAGYASVFDTPYEVYGFTESVSPRAFNKTLKERKDDLAVVWSHDADRVLGTVESGTARFEADEKGLRYEADLDLMDPDGMSAWRKITTGKVRKSSFAFEVIKDKWEEPGEDDERTMPHRVLQEVRLYEASPVLFPASNATEVDVKRAVESYAEYRGVELAEAATIEDIRAASSACTTEESEDATTEPKPEPETHSEATPEPEPEPAPIYVLPI